MQGHFSKHISTLTKHSFAIFMQYHIDNPMAILPKDLNFTSMQGRFGKHMAILSRNSITI